MIGGLWTAAKQYSHGPPESLWAPKEHVDLLGPSQCCDGGETWTKVGKNEPISHALNRALNKRQTCNYIGALL